MQQSPKCPLCDGPVSARILYHGTVAYVDGAQIFLTRTETRFLKIVSHGGMISTGLLAAILDLSGAQVHRHGKELQRKLRRTSVRLRKRPRGKYYIDWN